KIGWIAPLVINTVDGRSPRTRAFNCFCVWSDMALFILLRAGRIIARGRCPGRSVAETVLAFRAVPHGPAPAWKWIGWHDDYWRWAPGAFVAEWIKGGRGMISHKRVKIGPPGLFDRIPVYPLLRIGLIEAV